jgi:hypothetical protein
MDDKDTKEINAVDTKSDKSAGCCSSNHGMKAVLIVVAVLIVLGGMACVARFAVGRHSFNQVAVERNVSFGGGNIEGSRDGRMMGGGGFRGQAGTSLIGKITNVDGNNVTIHKDSNNKDYTIVISDTTQIRKDGEIAAKSDLANGLAITAQGNANSSGQITANVIIIN